jgi:hypothetical protein
MIKQKQLASLLVLLGGIPFLYIVLTKTPFNWLYYVSLAMILGGTILNMVIDWKSGNKQQVKRRLITYGIIIAIAVILGLAL